MNEGKKQKQTGIKTLILLNLILLGILSGVLILSTTSMGREWLNEFLKGSKEQIANVNLPEQETNVHSDTEDPQEPQISEEDIARLKKEEKLKNLVSSADKLALSYFYEEAISLIQSYEGDYTKEEILADAVKRYQLEIDSLVLYDGPINHVFFHSLIADNSKAFDGDRMENGYNYWMTTVSEFNKIMEQMYERGYVLVSIHDVAGTQGDGGKIKKKDLWLPPGKKPFVLSQDDVNYYEYMKNDGFATRLVLDEEGNSACEITIDNKTIIARDYDVVPLLDVFVEAHPDFSYRGAKGIIGVTGYEGALGYRTNKSNSASYEKDKKKVREIAQGLKKNGWEFASHSYGHRHMNSITYEKFVSDADKWKKEVEELVGETDIYIYPYGEEINYPSKQYKYLKELGFNYFCGVYAKPWIEITNEYVRMTRRNLDGFTMHYYPERVKDLYDLDYVFDKERPEFKN